MSDLKKMSAYLHQPVDAIQLLLFRMVFGLVIMLQVFSFVKVPFIRGFFELPKINIQYEFFEWLHPLPSPYMKIFFPLFFICGLLIMLGYAVRWSAIVLTISFTYFLLLDKSYFNNHFYVISLLSFWFIFYEVKAANQSTGVYSCKQWMIDVFKYHIVFIYFFGGIVKINSDWLLHQQPTRVLMEALYKSSGNSFYQSDFILYVVNYGGLVFDLLIGFLLLSKRYRTPAIIATLVFNVSNHFMFSNESQMDIGIFPILMIGANLLFIDADTLNKWMAFLKPSKKEDKKQPKKKLSAEAAEQIQPSANSNGLVYALIVYFVIHLLVPFRHYLFKGHVDWTGQAQHFAWRMKIKSKYNQTRIYAIDSKTGEKKEINPIGYLNAMQWKTCCENPTSMHQFVIKLKPLLVKAGYNDPKIVLDWKMSLNGRPLTTVIQPDVDLASVPYVPLKSLSWIEPVNDFN
jgi:vitamin K-dependent gamma-carboxylase